MLQPHVQTNLLFRACLNDRVAAGQRVRKLRLNKACLFRVMRFFFFSFFSWVFEINFFLKKTELTDEAWHSKTVDKTTQEDREHTDTHTQI